MGCLVHILVVWRVHGGNALRIKAQFPQAPEASPERGEQPPPASSGAVDVLVFEVAGQRYGIAASDVQEVVPAVTPVPLPAGPAIVQGVVNLRGRVVPVLGVRARFRLPAKRPDVTDHLIVAWAGPRLVAVPADRAVGLEALDVAQIEDAVLLTSGAGYVAGVAKLADGLVIIHDLATFLSQAEAEQLDEALEDEPSSGRS